ncbi:unnamed protein product [Menidia menidia]|uniref:(Atlantic silverside) hypothetical protein n=1 Tax=Menidia menidia TaxID=238744 RepID=A0A8S4BHR5_9TELE|nr:unnamed protein product [Menidia menidia]
MEDGAGKIGAATRERNKHSKVSDLISRFEENSAERHNNGALVPTTRTVRGRENAQTGAAKPVFLFFSLCFGVLKTESVHLIVHQENRTVGITCLVEPEQKEGMTQRLLREELAD